MIQLTQFTRFISLLLVVSGLIATSASAMSAAAQFNLNTDVHSSSCFINCANKVTNTFNLPGKDTNFFEAITLNCQWEMFHVYMGECLPTECVSAPDVAYAVEYGRDFCARAHVYGVQPILTSDYLATPGGAYYNSTLTSAATPSTPIYGITALSVLTLAVVFTSL